MNDTLYHWAVIGAGPAGIATVGKLIDHGIEPSSILWLDPEFKVGDFGTKWHRVSSNTRVKFFTQFLKASQAFKYASQEHAINNLDPNHTCLLEYAADPLQWVTDHLKSTVQAITAKATQLKLSNRYWSITTDQQILRAKNVVLAIGAEPKSLTFPNIVEIPLSIALHPEKLSAACHPEDVVAVFGSSHSAIIIIKSLLENCHIKKVVNYYLQPLRYAVHFDDWILFDDTGLKGNTAEWARKYIDGQWPEKLERILSTEENIQKTLSKCNKAIYATGFQKRFISIEGMHTLAYNPNNGIIAPGLFGIGIAFPEAKIDRYGTLEYRVGLWKFMEYLHHVMPVWLKYGT